MRKNIYLDVAEAIQALLVMIRRFPDTCINNVELAEELNEKRGAFAKANLIAREKLVIELMSFNTEFTAQTFDLMLTRQEVLTQKDKIARLDSYAEKLLKERDEALSTVNGASLNGTLQQKQIDVLDKIFERTSENLDLLKTEREPLSRAMNQALDELFKKTMHASKVLNNLLPKLVAEARAELEIPIDQDIYARAWSTTVGRQEQLFSDFLLKITGKPISANSASELPKS